MNIDFLTYITKDIKEYSKNSKYNPKVTTKRVQKINNNPVIVLKEENNITSLVDTKFLESTDEIIISANIYTKEMSIGNETVSDIAIARELMKIVDDVIFKKYKMRRKSAKPTPNLDKTIYRVVMIYSKKIMTNRNILI